MAYYAYKEVRDLLPAWICAEIDDYEGEANYDGDQWSAAANYIDYLIDTIQSFDKDFDFTKRIIKE